MTSITLPVHKNRHSKSLFFALFVIVVFCILAILAPWIAPHDPYQGGFKNADLPPMWVQNAVSAGTPDHPLGTDMLGRDIFSRYLYGVRTAFILIIFAIPITALLGTLIGMLSGYFNRRLDAVLVTIMDIIQSLPGIMFAVTVVLILRYIFPPSWLSSCIILVIGFSSVGWVGLARMIRAEVLRLKSMLFFEAAVSLGATNWRIITKHLFPNIAHLVLVWIINNIPAIILLEAILGYIGVSLTSTISENDFTIVSWGGLFYAGRSALTRNPMMLFVPALSLLLLSMSFVLIGDYYNRKHQL
jgi:peptide/nickel transport system permease protein